MHCTWVTSNAYSSPSVVLASRMPDGSQHIIDDYREAYQWLRQNTPDKRQDHVVVGLRLPDRRHGRPPHAGGQQHLEQHAHRHGRQGDELPRGGQLPHNAPATRSTTSSSSSVACSGYSGDDINKFLWMVRIAEGIWPDEVKEREYFTARGEYRVDNEATDTMKNSLM